MTGLVVVGRWLRANAFNLILAIVLAVLVWIVAEQQANPSREAEFPEAIPIVKLNVPANMITYDESDDQVRVTLSAPDSVWNTLTADRLSATIDLSGQPTGTLELPVNVSVSNRAASVIKIDKPVVTLKMEPQVEKPMAAKVNINGEPALGYSAEPLHMTPPVIIVRGPQSKVNQVSMVSGQMSI